LKAIKDRGAVVCGVSPGVMGFSLRSGNGEWTGIDVDFCRALAAAIFDDAAKVRFVPLSADDRFRALQSKEIDVLSRNSTWTMSRETGLGLIFAGVTFYDGQGLMVRHARNVSSALELNGSRVCVQTGTTTELNLQDYFRANGMTYEPIPAASAEEARRTYESGRCDVLTTDASALHGERLMTANPNDHDILPEIISKEPLGRRCARMMSNGSTSSNGRISPCSTLRSSASARKRSMRPSDRPSQKSGGWSATKETSARRSG
jgi:general L-amino acid transport system substrate-binding protein